MYTNEVYPYHENPNVEDLSVVLKINNCGHYKVHTTPVIETVHPEGRNDYQLLYIAHGKGHFYFKNTGTETIVRKGNMVLFRPGEPQVYYYYVEDKTEVYWVHFTGSHAESILEHYELPKQENVFFGGEFPDYPWMFNQMIRELQLQRVNYEEMLEMVFKQILLSINRYVKEGKQKKSDLLNEMERAVHYIEENYNKEISVKQYASEHLMTVNRFISEFKNIMKTTPMQYVVSLRIAAAKEYFDSTNKNVTEVSSAVGYDNPLYFSRLFKKYTGYSPSAYRKIKRDKTEE
ncbi:MAG: AraC family transcriptional regulator [Clostridia bacterium]|nr:AraC family transcriptional regulator [Clostridia bacterium]